DPDAAREAIGKPAHEGLVGGAVCAHVAPDDVKSLLELGGDAVQRGRDLVDRAEPEDRVADLEPVAQCASQEPMDGNALDPCEAVMERELDTLAHGAGAA